MRFSACPGQYIQPGPPFNDYSWTLDHMSMNETSAFLNFQRALDLESQSVAVMQLTTLQAIVAIATNIETLATSYSLSTTIFWH